MNNDKDEQQDEFDLVSQDSDSSEPDPGELDDSIDTDKVSQEFNQLVQSLELKEDELLFLGDEDDEDDEDDEEIDEDEEFDEDDFFEDEEYELEGIEDDLEEISD